MQNISKCLVKHLFTNKMPPTTMMPLLQDHIRQRNTLTLFTIRKEIPFFILEAKQRKR